MTRRSLRFERGSVAVESALALAVLVSAFASLMHIVGDIYAEDHAARGARTVARALATNPSADPWAALRREGLLDAGACPEWPDTDTGACAGWTLTVHRGISPATLGAAFAGGATADGDMVLVRLKQGSAGSTEPVSIGVARSEFGN